MVLRITHFATPATPPSHITTNTPTHRRPRWPINLRTAGAHCKNCSSLFFFLLNGAAGGDAARPVERGAGGAGERGGRAGAGGLAAACAHGRSDQTPGRMGGATKKHRPRFSVCFFFTGKKKQNLGFRMCYLLPCLAGR
jgi:hypothetical protein